MKRFIKYITVYNGIFGIYILLINISINSSVLKYIKTHDGYYLSDKREVIKYFLNKDIF